MFMAVPSGIFTYRDIKLGDRSIGIPLGSLPIKRSIGRSEIEREINQDILMEKGLVFLASPSGISTDQEIGISISW